MIQFRGNYTSYADRLAKQIRRAGYKALERLGFLVRARAQKSIKPAAGPSAPGQPPHTHSAALPKAILYSLEKEPTPHVLIGPTARVAGDVGAAFEHPGQSRFRGAKYPPRPFMGPALGEEIGDLPGLLAEHLSTI